MILIVGSNYVLLDKIIKEKKKEKNDMMFFLFFCMSEI